MRLPVCGKEPLSNLSFATEEGSFLQGLKGERQANMARFNAEVTPSPKVGRWDRFESDSPEG